jgi:hypothetical protein
MQVADFVGGTIRGRPNFLRFVEQGCVDVLWLSPTLPYFVLDVFDSSIIIEFDAHNSIADVMMYAKYMWTISSLTTLLLMNILHHLWWWYVSFLQHF